MSKIRLYGDTSGYVELAAPDVSPDATLTLPSTFAGIGSNVVSATKTDTFFTTATTPVDITGLSVSITPTDATSKILVLVSISGSMSGNPASAAFFDVLRGSTSIINASSPGSRTVASFFDGAYGGTPNSRMHLYNMVYLDAPATTSPTTYKVTTGSRVTTGQAINRSATDSNDADHPRGVSTIIAIEVAT